MRFDTLDHWDLVYLCFKLRIKLARPELFQPFLYVVVLELIGVQNVAARC